MVTGLRLHVLYVTVSVTYVTRRKLSSAHHPLQHHYGGGLDIIVLNLPATLFLPRLPDNCKLLVKKTLGFGNVQMPVP